MNKNAARTDSGAKRGSVEEFALEVVAARKVADAAGKFIDASKAWRRIKMDSAKVEVIVGDLVKARAALGKAVREYRKLLQEVAR